LIPQAETLAGGNRSQFFYQARIARTVLAAEAREMRPEVARPGKG
jgi:hypothetical protein